MWGGDDIIPPFPIEKNVLRQCCWLKKMSCHWQNRCMRRRRGRYVSPRCFVWMEQLWSLLITCSGLVISILGMDWRDPQKNLCSLWCPGVTVGQSLSFIPNLPHTVVERIKKPKNKIHCPELPEGSYTFLYLLSKLLNDAYALGSVVEFFPFNRIWVTSVCFNFWVRKCVIVCNLIIRFQASKRTTEIIFLVPFQSQTSSNWSPDTQNKEGLIMSPWPCLNNLNLQPTLGNKCSGPHTMGNHPRVLWHLLYMGEYATPTWTQLNGNKDFVQ